MRQLLRGSLLLTATLFATQAMMLVAARITYRDPFAPYRAIMPGQPVDAVMDFGCHRRSRANDGEEIGYCHFEPDGGAFAQVNVISFEHTITRTDFYVRSNRLALGDLVLCSGEPIHTLVFPPYPSLFLELFWGNQAHARVNVPQNLKSSRYMQPILNLSVARVWRPNVPEAVSCA